MPYVMQIGSNDFNCQLKNHDVHGTSLVSYNDFYTEERFYKSLIFVSAGYSPLTFKVRILSSKGLGSSIWLPCESEAQVKVMREFQ